MKKGFTLAEILGVIVIIGILLILIVPTVINNVADLKDDVQESNYQLIYEATNQYVKEHPEKYPPGSSGRYCISIKSLIDDGKLIESSDVLTNEDISNKSVMITIYSSGAIDYEIRDGDDCEEFASLPMIDFIVDPSGSAWVKKRKVTIIYPNVEGDYEAEYRIINQNGVKKEWNSVPEANNGGTAEVEFNKISSLEARLKGKQIISSKINLINIDSVDPILLDVKTGEWKNGYNNIEITARDDISGLAGLYISTTDTEPDENDSKWIDITSKAKEKKTFIRSLGLGTYYIWVKDKAGNISEGMDTPLEVVDNVKPRCTINDTGSKGENNWYIGDVTIAMTTEDDESGVAEYGMGTNTDEEYNGVSETVLKYDTKSQTYYGYVKDNAGNTNTCMKSVKRDTVKPICTLEIDGIMGNSNWYKSDVNISLIKDDLTSGVASYGVSTKKTADYNNKSSFIQTSDIAGVTYYGYVKDDAGHTSKCEKTFKKDATGPSCVLNVKSATTDDVLVEATCTDLSGVAKYEYSIKFGSYVDNGTKKSYTFDSFDLSTIRLRTTDVVGNTSITAFTQDGLERGYNIINAVFKDEYEEMLDKVNLYEDSMLDKNYPIGSIYISTSSTNPSTLVGGKWERYAQGRTIIGTGSNGTTSYTNGSTGGTENVTLAITNLPSHNHTVTPLGTVSSKFSGKTTKTSSNGSHTHSTTVMKNLDANEDTDQGIATQDVQGADLTDGFKDRLLIDGGNRSLSSNGSHFHTYVADGTVSSKFTGSSTSTSSTGKSSVVNVLNPYIVTYIWKRIA